MSGVVTLGSGVPSYGKIKIKIKIKIRIWQQQGQNSCPRGVAPFMTFGWKKEMISLLYFGWKNRTNLLKPEDFMSRRGKFLSLAFCFFFIMKTFSVHAFDIAQVKNDIYVELSKDLKASSTNQPVLILVGGYPGAGKTTLINALLQIYDMDVISRDSIRQALVDRHIKGSPYDWEIIETVNHNLFKNCLERNVNIIIDANAYANNIKLFEKLLDTENARDKYRVLKICLNPPPTVLLNRILAREQKEGVHQGTEADLLRDLNSKYKKIDMADYSLIINNDYDIDFETELNIVNAFLKPFFE